MVNQPVLPQKSGHNTLFLKVKYANLLSNKSKVSADKNIFKIHFFFVI